jgi:hypothetical protein
MHGQPRFGVAAPDGSAAKIIGNEQSRQHRHEVPAVAGRYGRFMRLTNP